MKKLSYFLVAGALILGVAAYYGPSAFGGVSAKADAEEGRTGSSVKTPEPSEGPETEPSETPEASETPEVSGLPGTENAQHQQEKAQEKINDANEKLNELAALIAGWDKNQPLPQNVETLQAQAEEKLKNAEAAFESGNYGTAIDQAQAAESLAENAKRILENENEAGDIEEEISKGIENESIKKIEIRPGVKGEGIGHLKIEDTQGNVSSKQTPFSVLPVVKIETPDSGVVGVSVASGSKVILDNEGIKVESDLPVSVDPINKTVSVATPSGIVVIKILPFQAFGGLNKSDQISEFQSVKLEAKNNKIEFQAKGLQDNRFLGIVPVKVPVETTVDAQNGDVLSTAKPWYLSVFGFLFVR